MPIEVKVRVISGVFNMKDLKLPLADALLELN